MVYIVCPEQQVDDVDEETAETTKLISYTVRSRIKVTATSRDDREMFRCEAHHEALSDPLTSTIRIRVLCEFLLFINTTTAV